MSAIAEPPVASPPVPAPIPRGSSALPESAVRKPEGPSADELFQKHQIENGLAPAAVTPPADAKPPEGPKPADAPPSPPLPRDAGSNLADQFIPESAKTKEPEKPAAAASSGNPEDAVTLDKSYSQKAHESFAQVKTITKGLRDQLQQRSNEVTELKAEVDRIKAGAVTVDSPEVATLRAEHEAMSKRLMVVDLQSHPKFTQEFVAPRNAALDDARTILAAGNISGVDVEALLSKDPVTFRKDLSAIAAKLPTALDQSDFANAMRTAHTLKQRGDAAVGKAGEINQAMRTQQVNGYKTAFDGTFAKTLGALNAKELVVPADATPEQRLEAEAFNQGFRAIRSESEKIALGTTDPEGISRASIKAAMYDWQVKSVLPLMAKTIKQREAEVAELKGQLANIRARNPNAQIRGVDHANGGIDPYKMGHHEAAEHFANLGRGGN